MEKEHLPVYGPGPFYTGTIIIITVLCVIFHSHLPSGQIVSLPWLCRLCGSLLIIAGIALWVYAVILSKIDDGIVNNRLVTEGAYALVRNPIYSAFMLVCDGILLWLCNLWCILPALFYWLFMTVLMKATEEKWLRDRYDQAYIDYCQQVNRCWPWFPEKNHG